VLESLGVGATVFIVIFLILRGLELAYHKLRHTPDWSPHWGSWAFAVLAGLYGFLASYGR
jgi:cytochrome bd-type quinol oxidase subunit 2